MTPHPTCCYRHRARFDWSRPCGDLARPDLTAILEVARAILHEAEEDGDVERAMVANGVLALAEQLLAAMERAELVEQRTAVPPPRES